jgi:hypothetical protein
MPVPSKLSVWDGSGKRVEHFVSFCYDIWVEHKSKLKKFFEDNEISNLFKSDTDLCEISQSAHFASITLLNRYKVLTNAAKRGSGIGAQSSLSEEVRSTKKRKIEKLKKATDDDIFTGDISSTSGTTIVKSLYLTPVKGAKLAQFTLNGKARGDLIKKLEDEYDDDVITHVDIEEAAAKLELLHKVDMKGASASGVNMLKDEMEELNGLLNKCFKELIYCFSKKTAPKSFDWSAPVLDDENILETTAHSLFGALCNLTQGTSSLDKLTSSMKHSLKEYLWFLSIFNNETTIKAQTKSVESVLACSLSNVLKKDVSTAHFTILAHSDPRVLKGTVSQFDFYVEAANLMARPAAATNDNHSDRKRVNFIKDKGQTKERDATSESEEESYKFKDVVRALSKLEKDPNGICNKEIKTEFHSTKVKSLFERMKAEKEQIASDESDSASDSSAEVRTSRKGRPKPKKKSKAADEDSETQPKDKTKQKRDKSPKTSKKKARAEEEDAAGAITIKAIQQLGATLGNTLATAITKNNAANAAHATRDGGNQRGRDDRDSRRRPNDYNTYRAPDRRNQGREGGDRGRDRYQDKGRRPEAHDARPRQTTPYTPPKLEKGQICDNIFTKGECTDEGCSQKHGFWDRSAQPCRFEEEGKCCDWLMTKVGCRFNHSKIKARRSPKNEGRG